jgi:TonB family protein
MLHVGAVSLAQIFWQSQTASELTADVEAIVQPVEFVYLEPDKSPLASAPDTARRANLNAVAGGEHTSDRAVNAGAADPQPPLTKAVTTLPNAAKPEPLRSTPAIASARSTPAQSAENQSAENKFLEPVTADKPEQVSASNPSPRMTPIAAPTPTASPAATSAAPPLPAAPAAPTDPEPVAPLPNRSANAADESATAPPLPVGAGLDGLPNANRPAPGAPGIDAQQDPVWHDYVAAVNRTVYEHWQRIPIDRTVAPTVRVTIDRSGQIVELQLSPRSGSDAADRAAITAVQAAAPFAPLPAETAADRLVVNIRFFYNGAPQHSSSR